MSCLYFDRQGNAIARDRWHELSAHPTYQQVTQTRTPGGTVETSWCGLILSLERRPTLFVVRLISTREEDRSRQNLRDSIDDWQWFATEEEAQFAHEQLVETLGGRL